MRVFDIEAKETAEEIKARIQKVLKDGLDDFETQHYTKQGEVRHVHVTAQIIEVAGQNLYHCIWRDITERKQSEISLLKSEEQFRHFFDK